MIRKTGFLLFLFLAPALGALAQKVKYKELFPLLNNPSERPKAEPFLKRYLKDNTDNPNAYLFMGIIYQEKSGKTDPLKQTEALNLLIDSAINNYSIALKNMTEKEVKRNDEYYENYRKRDLRTAESGIKLSDIQFDLEQRIKGLKEKKDRLKQLREYFVEAEAAYQHSNAYYKAIQAEFPGQKEFILRAGDGVLTKLKWIVNSSDSCSKAFASYKATSQLIGKTGYNQVIDFKEIKDLKNDGGNLTDFYKDDLRMWDYKTWATSTTELLEHEVFPMRETLITCDIDINKVRAKIKKDSVSGDDDLKAILKRPVFTQLKKYDPDPLPLAILRMKAAELEYTSEVVVNHKSKDTANIAKRLTQVKRELARAKTLDSLTALLAARNLDGDIINYNHFVVSAYGSADVLTSLIKTTKDFSSRETLHRQMEERRRMKSLSWLVSAPDSIPLFTDASIRKNKFKPLVIMPDDNTAGMKYADSLSAAGYFFTITPSHIPDIKANFQVPAAIFNKRNLPIIHALTAHDDNNSVYYTILYSEAKTKDKFTAVVAKIYRTDGLAWSRTYPLDMLPSSMSYAADTGELSIKISSPAGDHKIVVLDKAGKQIQ